MSTVKRNSAFALAACATIGGFEGVRQNAYSDVIGVPTICYGETQNVRLGQHATKPECDAELIKRLAEFDDGILRCLRTAPPDGPHLAFLSLSYNLGVKGFCKSSVARDFNAGRTAAACDDLLKFDEAGGVTWPGLTRRRAKEQTICKEGLPR